MKLALALLVLAGSARATSLTEASEEAKAMAKLIKENPCYHNIELSVRSIQASFAAAGAPNRPMDVPPPRSVRLHHDRACTVTGAPSAPRAERLYLDYEGSPWGVRLTTARGSDETSVDIVRRDTDGRTWVSARLGTYKTAELLARAVSERRELSAPTPPAPPGMLKIAVISIAPYAVTIETIPYEHD